MPPKTTAEEKIQALSKTDEKRLTQAYRLADRPEEFARFFCEVSEQQTSVKKKIQEILKESLTSDTEAIKALKEIVKDVEKENMMVWLKTTGGRILFAIWSISLVVLGGWAQSFFK